MTALRRFVRSRLRRDDERGVVLIVVAVVMVVALAFLAIVIDLSNGRQTRLQAQAAADASAIAAAEELAAEGAAFTGSDAQWATIVDVAKSYALNNFNVTTSAWQDCTDPGHLSFLPDLTAHNNSCISSDLVAWPNPQPGETTWITRIRVRTPTRTLETVFGGAVDQQQLSTQAVATAGVTRKRTLVTTAEEFSSPGGPCAICVLGDGLTLDGQNGDVTVTGGGVTVNSNPSSGYAATLNPNGHVKVTVITGQNGNSGIGGPGGPGVFSGSGWSPAPTTKPAIDDPLASIPYCGLTQPLPAEYNPGGKWDSWPGCPTTSQSSSPSTLNPGVYSSAIVGTHFLNPGVYVLKAGIKLSGNQQLTGRNVTLYFACSNYPDPCSSATDTTVSGIKATGNGAVLLTAPTAATCTNIPSTCPYVGLTVFADRANTSQFTFRGNGTNENGAQEGSSGTLYLKSGTLDLRGNGYTLASQIITGKLTMEGNPSGITVAYDLSRNAAETVTWTETTTTEAYSYDATGLST